MKMQERPKEFPSPIPGPEIKPPLPDHPIPIKNPEIIPEHDPAPSKHPEELPVPGKEKLNL